MAFHTQTRSSSRDFVLAASAALIVGVALTAVLTVAARGADLRALVDDAADSASIPRAVAHAIVAKESDYRPALRGRAGEWGLGQIKCQTARESGFRGACAQLADPATNLRWSMAYLRLALTRGGQGCAGFTLYNTGIYAKPRCSHYGRAIEARLR